MCCSSSSFAAFPHHNTSTAYSAMAKRSWADLRIFCSIQSEWHTSYCKHASLPSYAPCSAFHQNMVSVHECARLSRMRWISQQHVEMRTCMACRQVHAGTCSQRAGHQRSGEYVRATACAESQLCACCLLHTSRGTGCHSRVHWKRLSVSQECEQRDSLLAIELLKSCLRMRCAPAKSITAKPLSTA